MLSNDTGYSSIAENSQCESVVIFSLFDRPTDKSRCVDKARAVVQPGQPFFQIWTVAIDQLREFYSIISSNLAQLDTIVYMEYHGAHLGSIRGCILNMERKALLSARSLPKRQPPGELDILCSERTDARARQDDTQQVERIGSGNAQRRFGRCCPSHGSQQIDCFGPCELLA